MTAMQEGVEEKKMLTIRVPAELHREARVLSVREGVSLNELVTRWLTSWVKRMKEEGE
jgi:predicted HicB family RNase H-like nuclease